MLIATMPAPSEHGCPNCSLLQRMKSTGAIRHQAANFKGLDRQRRYSHLNP
jgi:hypothetical protein